MNSMTLLQIVIGAWLGVLLWEFFEVCRRLPKFLRKSRPLSCYVRIYKFEIWEDLGIPIRHKTVVANMITVNTITTEKILCSTVQFTPYIGEE